VKEKKETKPKECPDCYQQFVGLRCKCGYEIPKNQVIETDGTILQEVKDKKKANRDVPRAEKEKFLGELMLYARQRGFKQGWAQHKYRDRFGVWGSKVKAAEVSQVSQDTKNWITHTNIKWSRSKHG